MNLENILFIDVETVPMVPEYTDLNPRWKALWDKKASYLARDEQTPEDIFQRSGIYAEFGKIICISAAFLVLEGKEYQLRVKSFYGDDEKEILTEFCALLDSKFNLESQYLCAHNGKEFDYPYLCRRILINQLPVPDILNLSGKKPWEVRHFDTLQMWKFGDYKNYTSLDLLAACFGIETPKGDVDGSMIYDIYYNQKDLLRIKNYCQKDVLTLVNVFLHMHNCVPISEEQIIEVS